MIVPDNLNTMAHYYAMINSAPRCRKHFFKNDIVVTLEDRILKALVTCDIVDLWNATPKDGIGEMLNFVATLPYPRSAETFRVDVVELYVSNDLGRLTGRAKKFVKKYAAHLSADVVIKTFGEDSHLVSYAATPINEEYRTQFNAGGSVEGVSG